MAGIFSLGRVSSSNNNQEGQEHNPITNQITPENWLWYNKNDDVSYKGGASSTTFELWQQQAELLHHQQRQQQDPYYSTTAAAGLGVGPSSRRSGINVVGGFGGGGSSCQDCGNQAKKDCAHMRCRTCCKSRGFDCQTHVKSTWVPASKRRDKQHQQPQQLQLQTNKRHKENPTSSSLACTRLPSTNVFGFEVGNLPAEVSTEALFRCVKVCGIDDNEDQYAYQTSVNIGGHLFKGILYDKGPDHESSSGGAIHEPVLNFINTTTTSTSIITPTTMPAADLAMASSSSTALFLDPSSLYPTPYTTFMATAGTQFFPTTRSS